MDIGNYNSLSYDPFLILIKNILSIFYFLAYFIELKINKVDSNIIEKKEMKLNNLMDDKENNDGDKSG
jgi:hypothetical protein